MKTCVVLFVEGDTDNEFFSKLTSSIHELCDGKRFIVEKVITRNIKGVGNYKKRVQRIFENQIRREYKEYSFLLFLCHDTDVDDSPKPPIEWDKVKKSLLAAGAKRVIEIKAQKSIEEWFLFDLKGLLEFLKLPADSKCSGKDAICKIEKLFLKANRVYIKGQKCEGLIDALDILTIMGNICK